MLQHIRTITQLKVVRLYFKIEAAGMQRVVGDHDGCVCVFFCVVFFGVQEAVGC